MSFFINFGEILGAIASSKMTGDVRDHASWILKFALFLMALAYLATRT